MSPPTAPPLRTLDDIIRFERAAPLEARLPGPSLYDVFVAGRDRLGDRAAITMIMTGDETETPRVVGYRELCADVTRAANLFAELGGEGVGVAYLLPNLVETQLTLWGAETAGYAVPLNFLLQPEQVADLIRASGAKILVAPGPHPESGIWEKALRVRAIVPGLILLCVEPPSWTGGMGAEPGLPGEPPSWTGPLPDGALSFAEGLARQPSDRLTFGAARSGDQVAACFHTGGTTGAPKLVLQTHKGQLTSAFGAVTLLGFGEDDVFTHGLPMFHTAGFIMSLCCLLARGHAVLLSPAGFRNPAMVQRHWRIVERVRATVIGAVPTSIGALCEVPVDGDLARVRFAVTGAAATPRAVVERFEAHTGKALHEVLGMTEGSGIVAVDPTAGARTIGSVGLRLPYTEVRVRRLGANGRLGEDCAPGEVGVLTVKGPHVSPGYRAPVQSCAWLPDGWLDTGDLVHIDEAGRLHVAGRSKDLIIRSGHNLDPAMIEEAFTAHPAVALAAAVGAPDVYAGELPVCYVTLRPGFTTDLVTVEALRAFAEARLAERPAWPKQVHIVETLPLTGVGKIYKPALRAEVTRSVAEAAVTRELGHQPAAITATPGGARGMKVVVTLAPSDAGRRDAVEAALGGYLFETVVSLGEAEGG